MIAVRLVTEATDDHRVPRPGPSRRRARPPPPTPRSAPPPSRRPRRGRGAPRPPPPPRARQPRGAHGQLVAERLAASASRCATRSPRRASWGPQGRAAGALWSRCAPTSTPCHRGERTTSPFKQPDEGRDARLRPRRPHGDPARHGRGAGRAEGAASRHRGVPVPTRRGGRPRGEEGGAPLMVRRARWTTRRSRRSSACTSAAGARRPGRLDRRADLRLGRRFTIEVEGKTVHGAQPHMGLDPIPIAAEMVWRSSRSSRARSTAASPASHDRPDPGRHALQHHRGPGDDGRARSAPTTRPSARR